MAATKSNYNTRAKRSCQRTASISKENTTTRSPKVKRRKIPVEDYDENMAIRSGKNSDMFCWKCHEFCVDQYCTACPKVFHSYCITRANNFNDKGECHSCQQLSNKESVTDIQLSDKLVLVLKSSMKETNCCIENPKMTHIIDWENDSEIDKKLFSIKDLLYIEDKCVIEDIQYDSYLELLDDVRWIYHNCCIKYGVNSTKATSAKKLLDKISLELDDALDCPECYFNKKADEPVFFLHICNKPHPLVWAKLKGYPYWPAKCLKVQNKKAHIRYFHTHQIAKVPITSCLFLSKDYPINTKTIKKSEHKVVKTDGLKRAQVELDEYINIYVEKFGVFPYEPVNTPFDFEKGEKVIKELLDEFKKNKSRRIYETSSAIHQQHEKTSTDDESEECELLDLTVEDDDSNENIIARAEKMPEQNRTDARVESDANTIYCIEPPISLSSTGISISNIFSSDIRTDPSFLNHIPIENGVIATAEPLQGVSSGQNVHQEDDIELIAEFPAPNINKEKLSENDMGNLIQAIVRVDPRANNLMKYINSTIQKFFIQFWANASTVVNAETVISKQENELEHQKLNGIQQENEIRNLKSKIGDLENNTNHLIANYETRLKNSEWIWKGLKIEKKKRQEAIEKEHNLKVQEMEKKHNEELEKAKNWCSKTDCNKIAIKTCCYDGQNIIKYCSRDCLIADKEHHPRCKKHCSSSTTPETNDDSHNESAEITVHDQMEQVQATEATSSSTEIEREAYQEILEDLSNESTEIDADNASPSSSLPDSSSCFIGNEKEPKQIQAMPSSLFGGTRKMKSGSEKKSRHTQNPQNLGHLF